MVSKNKRLLRAAAVAPFTLLMAIQTLAQIDVVTPDSYLTNTITAAKLKNFKRALQTFREGAARFPNDPRFHSERVAFYKRNAKIEGAKAELRAALVSNLEDISAVELLASLDMSEGDFEGALRLLNKQGQPRIARTLDNQSPDFSSSVLSHSVAFQSGRVLGYHDWLTTAARLRLTDAFSSVGLEIEQSSDPGTYDADLRTTRKKNELSEMMVDLVSGLPVRTVYVNVANIDGSFAQFKSSYRWISSRRRAEGDLSYPIPLLGGFQVGGGFVWRSELWDAPMQSRFRYNDSAVRFDVTHISDHRIEFGAGVKYERRSPVPDIAKLLVHAQYRPLNGRFKSQTRVDGFGSRASILGGLNEVGATVDVANRLVVFKDSETFLDVSFQGGTLRGYAPIEDYFVLGVDDQTDFPLRGHPAALHNIYGDSPMGTDFVLMNNSIERRVATMPYLQFPIKAEGFVDIAKVFDRNRIYPQVGWLFDTGVGAKVELKDTELVTLYGRSLTDGKSLLSLSIQRRFW